MKRTPMKRSTPPDRAECIRLRREIQRTREQCAALLNDAARRDDHDRWKADVDARIARWNSAIRSTGRRVKV